MEFLSKYWYLIVAACIIVSKAAKTIIGRLYPVGSARVPRWVTIMWSIVDVLDLIAAETPPWRKLQ